MDGGHQVSSSHPPPPFTHTHTHRGQFWAHRRKARPVKITRSLMEIISAAEAGWGPRITQQRLIWRMRLTIPSPLPVEPVKRELLLCLPRTHELSQATPSWRRAAPGGPL